MCIYIRYISPCAQYVVAASSSDRFLWNLRLTFFSKQMDVLKKCSQALRKINSLVDENLRLQLSTGMHFFPTEQWGKFDPAQRSPHSSDRNFWICFKRFTQFRDSIDAFSGQFCHVKPARFVCHITACRNSCKPNFQLALHFSHCEGSHQPTAIATWGLIQESKLLLSPRCPSRRRFGNAEAVTPKRTEPPWPEAVQVQRPGV